MAVISRTEVPDLPRSESLPRREGRFAVLRGQVDEARVTADPEYAAGVALSRGRVAEEEAARAAEAARDAEARRGGNGVRPPQDWHAPTAADSRYYSPRLTSHQEGQVFAEKQRKGPVAAELLRRDLWVSNREDRREADLSFQNAVLRKCSPPSPQDDYNAGRRAALAGDACPPEAGKWFRAGFRDAEPQAGENVLRAFSGERPVI